MSGRTYTDAELATELREQLLSLTEHGRVYSRAEVRDILQRLITSHPDCVPQACFRTQRDMAEAAGVTQYTVTYVLGGHNTPGIKLPKLLGLVHSNPSKFCTTYVKDPELPA